MKKPIICAITFLAIASVTSSIAQTKTSYGPDGFITIAENTGGFTGDLDGGDRFGRDHDVAGDIDNDGVLDLVIGARSDDDGATDAGAVYILFMNESGTVRSHQKISMTEGGFTETLVDGNFFGYGVAGIGDYDGDSIPDIAVSATSAENRAIYIIHLNRNGTVKNYTKNTGIIAQGLSAVGDLDGDGRIDLVACDPGSDIGGSNRGAINILFFNANSHLVERRTVTIASDTSGFGQGLANEDSFGGREATLLGDLDDDGNKELAVGAFTSDGGKGAIWILSLDSTTFNVVSKVKIAEGSGGFDEILFTDPNPNGTSGAQFGHAMGSPGDLNGDGINDLITGANQQDEGYGYIIFLNADKTVKTFTRINNSEGGFDLNLDVDERFSRSISFIGDLRRDGSITINMGGGAGGTGALYLLSFKPCDFIEEPGFNFWQGGTTLFTNWSHRNQTVTGPLSFEQCSLKAQETDAAFITFKESDGRCICKDADAVLAQSEEQSAAFNNTCYSNYTETPIIIENPIVTMRKGNALAFGIDGDYGAANRQDIYLWTENSNNLNQQWEEIERGDGFYSYKKVETDHCIDGGSGGENGQNVYLWSCRETNQNQHWRKVNVGDGKFRLEKRNAPAFSIDGNRGGARGQSIYLWASDNANQNQQWLFESVGTVASELNAALFSNESEIKIYPVPVTDILHLSISKPEDISKIEIIDFTGKIVETVTNVTDAETLVDTGHLSKGVYVLKISNNTTLNSTSIKFVK